MPDNHVNFGFSLVATAPVPATTGTSLTVTAGSGALFPVAPFNCTVFPASAQPSVTNAEIIRVTAVVGDVLTIARAQEGSIARAILAGDAISNTITVKVLTDVESAVSVVSTIAANAASVASQAIAGVSVVSVALGNEVSNRTSADNALSTRLSDETSIRLAGDTSLAQQVSITSHTERRPHLHQTHIWN